MHTLGLLALSAAPAYVQSIRPTAEQVIVIVNWSWCATVVGPYEQSKLGYTPIA